MEIRDYESQVHFLVVPKQKIKQALWSIQRSGRGDRFKAEVIDLKRKGNNFELCVRANFSYPWLTNRWYDGEFDI